MKDCVKQWLGEQMPGSDETVLAPIYEEYVATAKRLIGEIAAIDKAAHTLKGNAMMVGDRQMADTAIALRGKIAELQNLLGEL